MACCNFGEGPPIEETDTKFSVNCGTKEAQRTLLQCNGMRIQTSGLEIKIASESRSTAFAEIYEWLITDLRSKEEAQAMGARFGSAEPEWISHLSAVDQRPQEDGYRQGRGKGRSRNREPRRADPRERTPDKKESRAPSRERTPPASSSVRAQPAVSSSQSTPAPPQSATPGEPSGKGVGGKGKGKGLQKPEDYDWDRDCRGCKYFGRPFKHDWRACEFNKKLRDMKDEIAQTEQGRQQLEAAGRTYRGKGKGTGKGKGAEPRAEA